MTTGVRITWILQMTSWTSLYSTTSNPHLPEYQSCRFTIPVSASNAHAPWLLEKCDVWTYSEEPDGRIGRVFYHHNNPPTSSSQIDTIKLFSQSFNNGAGEDCIPGTGFTWVDIQPVNPWMGHFCQWLAMASPGCYQWELPALFIPGLNPESDPNLQKHTLLLNDPNRLNSCSRLKTGGVTKVPTRILMTAFFM